MKTLKQFNKAADLVAEEFVKVYFDGQGDFHWIGNDRTGLIEINNNFIYLADIVFALENKVAVNMFSEYREFTSQEQYIPLRYYINTKKTEALEGFKSVPKL